MSLSMRDCNLHNGWLHLGEPNGAVIPPVYQENCGWPEEWRPLCGPSIPGSVTLVNNLFDRVNIDLDPDTGPCWWAGPYATPTIDMRLAATNNLFRGGWLFMEPISASAGNCWVFQNNLFDKTVFAQDANQPLNQDYNGYWQCDPQTELLVGQANKLKLDAAHDVLLAAEPPYDSGRPLGSFYLEDDSPLAGAGSCPPAGAGLYHYTTRTSQAKEANADKVSIGMHYIALETTGETAGQPKDSDTDGIPDYVENWHGDGDPINTGTGHRLHADTETDWQSNNSTLGSDGTPVEDKYSLLYDDVALAGDGVVGRIKKALHPANPQPLVPDNSLALEPVTVPGADPATLTFRVNLDYSTVSSIGKLHLLADGRAVALAKPEAGSGLCLLNWNTSFAAPGYHILSARQ